MGPVFIVTRNGKRMFQAGGTSRQARLPAGNPHPCGQPHSKVLGQGICEGGRVGIDREKARAIKPDRGNAA